MRTNSNGAGSTGPSLMPRRTVITVPPEWTQPRKGDAKTLRRAKRRLRGLTAKLGEADFRRVLAGRMSQSVAAEIERP